jgi:thymidylate synthase (FAD)
MDSIGVLDFGYVKLAGVLGDDITPVYAARLSFDGSVYEDKERNVKLLRYLIKNGHMTPFEHVVFSFIIKSPIFVARQIMRHRTFSYNEVSQRYTELTDGEYYLPDKFRYQSKDNKQSSEGEFVNDQLAQEIYTHYRLSTYLYQKLIDSGVAREQARIVLPISTYTKFIMTGNLRNWFHFLEERLSVDAQFETREYAKAIRTFIYNHVPICYGLWEELVLRNNQKYQYLFGEEEQNV